MRNSLTCCPQTGIARSGSGKALFRVPSSARPYYRKRDPKDPSLCSHLSQRDEDNIQTVIIAPMTSKGRQYPTRIPCTFDGKQGQIVLDQIRTVDKVRLVKHLGALDSATATKLLILLQEMFAE